MTTKYITKAWVASATAQDIFNYVADHLITQNRKSLIHTNPSLFGELKDEGVEWPEPILYCAAGCLLKDNEKVRSVVNDRCEFNSWEQLNKKGYAPNNQIELIDDLVIVHDRFDPEQWRVQLRLVAKKHKLDFAIKMKLK